MGGVKGWGRGLGLVKGWEAGCERAGCERNGREHDGWVHDVGSDAW